jgi:hypothetical protein
MNRAERKSIGRSNKRASRADAARQCQNGAGNVQRNFQRYLVFRHLTDDSHVVANQSVRGHEARQHQHECEPGEPGAARSDHCGS